jgi:hypothetical protein
MENKESGQHSKSKQQRKSKRLQEKQYNPSVAIETDETPLRHLTEGSNQASSSVSAA